MVAFVRRRLLVLAVVVVALVGVVALPASAAPVVGTPITVGSNPSSVAFTPDGTEAWVTNKGGSTVSVINVLSGSVTSITVGLFPASVAFTPDGKKAYVANFFGNSVSVIDVALHSVSKTIAIPTARPYFVAVSPDGQKAYVANSFTSTVSVIDTTADSVAATITLPSGSEPRSLAFSPDGSTVYVANYKGGASSTVSVITVLGGTLGTPITVGLGPSSVAFTPDGTKAYVTNWAGGNGTTVSVITVASGAVSTLTFPALTGPSAVAVSPDGTTAYVTNYSKANISVITVAGDAVDPTPIPLAVGAQPGSVAFSPDGTAAYATINGSTLNVARISTGLAPYTPPPRSYTVTYADSGATTAHTGGAASYSAASPLTLPTAPAKSGYTFTGWQLTGASVTTATVSWSATTATPGGSGNITLTAQWSAVSNTVTYIDSGATTAHTGGASSYSTGSSFVVPTAPAKDGYTFTGWQLTGPNATTGAVSPSATSATPSGYGNVTLTAQWLAVTNTVTYVDTGATTAHTGGASSYDTGSSFVVPTSPAKTGYTFTGWQLTGTNATTATVSSSATTATPGGYGNVTLTAQWSVVPPAPGSGAATLAKTGVNAVPPQGVAVFPLLVGAATVVVRRRSTTARR